jgi:hydrogenase maturation factor
MDFVGEPVFEGQVLSLEQSEHGTEGWVDFHGVRTRVNLSLVPGVEAGQWVVVNGRVAISRLEETDEISG